jgi:hypothetical protein
MEISKTKTLPCIHCEEPVEVLKHTVASKVECQNCKKQKQAYFAELREKKNMEHRKELILKEKQIDYDVRCFKADCRRSRISNIPKRSVKVMGR